MTSITVDFFNINDIAKQQSVTSLKFKLSMGRAVHLSLLTV